MDKAKDFEKGWEEYKAKSKQEIEEMYQEFLNYKFENSCPETFSYKGICEHFHKEGYRKIPKNAVVLTREEYASLVTRPSLNTAINVFDVRKETAEKFAERLKSDEDIKLILINVRYMQTRIDEAEKAIKRKIDKICKEITEGKNAKNE